MKKKKKTKVMIYLRILYVKITNKKLDIFRLINRTKKLNVPFIFDKK